MYSISFWNHYELLSCYALFWYFFQFLLCRIERNHRSNLLHLSSTRSVFILTLTTCTHAMNHYFRTCLRHIRRIPGSQRSSTRGNTEEWTRRHWRYTQISLPFKIITICIILRLFILTFTELRLILRVILPSGHSTAFTLYKNVLLAIFTIHICVIIPKHRKSFKHLSKFE